MVTNRRIYGILVQGALTALLGGVLIFLLDLSSFVRFLGALNILLGGILLGFGLSLRSLQARI